MKPLLLMIFSIILVLVGIYIVVLVGSPMGQLPPLEQEILEQQQCFQCLLLVLAF